MSIFEVRVDLDSFALITDKSTRLMLIKNTLPISFNLIIYGGFKMEDIAWNIGVIM